MPDVVNYRFRLRRGLAATWAATNDMLLDGEFGLETDTRQLKIGDGSTAWNDLPYFAADDGNGGVSVAITAGEMLSAGQFCYVGADGLTYVAGNASANTAATLYVAMPFAAHDSGVAQLAGVNEAFTGLSAGAMYALGTDGDVVLLSALGTAPGTLIQTVGTAISTSALAVSIQPAVLRG